MRRREPFMYALPRFSVTRPVSVIMLLLATVVVGVIAYLRIPIALFPEGQGGNMIGIYVPYANATPRDVEETITRKVEDIVGTVPNVKSLRSFSSNGSAFIRVEFQNGTDLQSAYAALRDRMDRVMPDLPDDVDRIWLRRWDQGEEAIVELVATLPADVDDAFYRIDHFVRPALQRIEGVGSVEMWGVQRREMMIDLDEERLRSHGIEPGTLVNTLRNQNLTLSGGFVRDGDRKIYVRSMGKFEDAESIANIIIDPVHRLRVRDVASVTLKPSRREWVYRVDQKSAISLEVMRESTGNIERISRDVHATIAELRDQPQLSGIKFEVVFDQGHHVRESIDHLKEAGLWGGLFAAIIVYAFLRAPRMTGILTLSIPLSLLCTIVVLFFMGWSLNMATMLGLLLAVGMVIDNSIVIVENIYRRRQEGLPATEASIVGAGEVGLAVTMATLTSIVVFLPLILMGGGAEFSFWMLRIGVPVIASLLASLVIALICVPLAAQRLSRGRQHHDPKAVAWLRQKYLGCLRWVLTHRIDAVIVVLLVGATAPFAIKNLQQQPGGGGNDTDVRLNFELPTGTKLEAADVFFSKVEAFLLANAERYGIERFESRFRNSEGRVRATLKQSPNNQWYEHAWDSFLRWAGWRKPPMDRVQIEADFREKFEMPPGTNLRSWQRGQGAVPQDASLMINLYGEDTETLLGLADEASRRLRSIPGLISVETDLERGRNELQVQLDRDRARRLGVNPQTVSSGISYTLRGLEVGRYYAPDGRELSIRVQLGDVDNQRMDDLRSMTFKTETGIDVPLESVATVNVSRTLGQIRRENRQTMLSLMARAPRSDSRRLFEEVDKAMEGFEMPRGYRWDKGARFVQLEESGREQKFALALAVTFVFLLMGLLFESFVLPLAVLVAVPFSFLGVYWTLYLTGTPMDNMAMIGTVILVGVVVNNAIVLVDMANRLRADGKERFEALIEAGRHRFRPILMTTLCTVSGLIPMAVGNSKLLDMPYAPLGRTMIGGLLTATILTLVVVPLFYTLLDDLREHVARVTKTAWAKPATPGIDSSGQAGAAPIGK